MTIREVRTGILHEIDINPIEKHDYNKISKTRYFFNWSNETAFENYKLTIKGSNDILGIISIERIPEEWRIHIRMRQTGTTLSLEFPEIFELINEYNN